MLSIAMLAIHITIELQLCELRTSGIPDYLNRFQKNNLDKNEL